MLHLHGQANFFDLSARNLAGKYEEKKGSQTTEALVQKVFKTAKAMQPSVIYIDEATAIFGKKSSKVAYDNTRLKKDLPKAVKGLQPGERVLVLGVDRSPYDTDMKTLATVFQKILLIPKPDYGSRFLLWKQILQQEGVTSTRKLDLNSLSKISDGYTAGDLTVAAREVLTPRRIAMLGVKPLAAVELVAPLARLEPVYTTEEEALKNW